MKEIIKVEYQCEVCNKKYGTESRALKCEGKPVTYDKGTKVGDIVIITSGEGVGQKAEVTKLIGIGLDWGPEKYWHTIALEADLVDSWGSRMLTFDSYKT